MSRFPDNVRQKVTASLTRPGVEILEKGYVSEITAGKITLESGTAYDADLLFYGAWRQTVSNIQSIRPAGRT